MDTAIPINLAVEDVLSEAVLLKILQQSGQSYAVGVCYNRGGFGYLKNMVGPFNHAAKGMPYLVLTDLDQAECPPSLITSWLPDPIHPNLLFRVAVKEVEAWLLAHQTAMARFLGIQDELIPQNVDEIDRPKQFLINLARRSRYRNIRETVVPPPKSTARVGRDYNGQMIYFVERHWQVDVAVQYSPSLRRAMNAVANFKPVWSS